MKITVVDPHNASGFLWDVSLTNGYLCSFLGKNNFEVDFIDCGKLFPPDFIKNRAPAEKEKYLEAVARAIEKNDPGLVLFNYKAFALPFVFEAAKKIKQTRPHTVAALGGCGHETARLLAEEITGIDYFIAGDIETSLKPFLDDLKNNSAADKIYNRGFLRPPGCLTPDFSFYENGAVRYIPYDISRGCPFGCEFCSRGGKPISRKSVEKVFSDIMMLSQKYKTEKFAFTDEYFNYDIKFLKDLLLRIKKTGINFKFMCNWVLDKKIDAGFMDFLTESGLEYLILSAESFPGRRHSDKKFYDKKYLFEYLRETAMKIKRTGVNVVVTLLCNSYNDTEESFKCLEEFVVGVRGKIELYVEPVLILPGAPLWQKYERGEITIMPRAENDMPEIKKDLFARRYAENILFSPQYWVVQNDNITPAVKNMLKTENWSYKYNEIVKNKYVYKFGDKVLRQNIELNDPVSSIKIKAAAAKIPEHKGFCLEIPKKVSVVLNNDIIGRFDIEGGLNLAEYKIKPDAIINPGGYAIEFLAEYGNLFIEWVEFESVTR